MPMLVNPKPTPHRRPPRFGLNRKPNWHDDVPTPGPAGPIYGPKFTDEPESDAPAPKQTQGAMESFASISGGLEALFPTISKLKEEVGNTREREQQLFEFKAPPGAEPATAAKMQEDLKLKLTLTELASKQRFEELESRISELLRKAREVEERLNLTVK